MLDCQSHPPQPQLRNTPSDPTYIKASGQRALPRMKLTRNKARSPLYRDHMGEFGVQQDHSVRRCFISIRVVTLPGQPILVQSTQEQYSLLKIALNTLRKISKGLGSSGQVLRISATQIGFFVHQSQAAPADLLKA